MDELWVQVSTKLQGAVGANNHDRWIKPLRLTALDEGVAAFEAPTRFVSDWVNRHFARQILDGLTEASGTRIERLRFEIRPEATAAPGESRTANGGKARAAAAAVAAGVARDDLGAPLDQRFTFDNFVVGKPNELAHAAARRVAEGGQVSFNPLFLYGGVGLGKTHLMHAIAHEYQRSQPQARVLYLSAEQFMYRFIQALRESTIMYFK